MNVESNQIAPENSNETILTPEICESIEWQQIADAVFLDLPNPQQVVSHASKVLKTSGILCSFSPNLEQVRATAKAMVQNSYFDIQTFEVIHREMISKPIPNKSLLGLDSKMTGLFVNNNDQKSHTGFLTFARKY